MGRIWSSFWIALIGMMSWLHTASASELRTPWQPPIESEPWVIEAAEYTGSVQDQVARLDVSYTIRILREIGAEVPIAIQGATITGINVEKKAGEVTLVPGAGSYRMIATKKGTYKVRVKFSKLISQDSQFEGLQLGLPRATFSTLTLFVPRKDVELRPEDQLYVEREPDTTRGGVKLIARLASADRVDLRWRTRPAAPMKVEPVFYGDVHTLMTLEEQVARINSLITYRVTQGEIKELRVVVPPSLTILNVRGAGINDWRIVDAPDHKTLTIVLGMPLKDTTYPLTLEGEARMESSRATFTIPEITLPGAKQERGYLAVARSGNLELEPQETTGMTRVDVRELPEQLASLAAGQAVLAYRYQQHPYAVVITVIRHQDHAVLAAIAERADLATVLSRQGELMTRAVYLVKANKKQFLDVRLPEGATLWSCIVGGTSVKPVEGTNGVLLVPLTTTPEQARGVLVEIVYFEHRSKLTGMGSLHLSGPQLDVPTTVANWTLYAPHEIKFLRMSGNIERGAAALDFLDEPFIQVASAGEVPWNEPKPVEHARKENRGMFRSASIWARHQMQAGEASNADSVGQRIPATAELLSSASRALEDARELDAFVGRLNETGILPLKIQLPKSGAAHRFSRLMTSQDALALEATFVHLSMPLVAACIAGLVACLGTLAVFRIRRA